MSLEDIEKQKEVSKYWPLVWAIILLLCLSFWSAVLYLYYNP